MRAFLRAVPPTVVLAFAAYVLIGLGRTTLPSAGESATPEALVTAACELVGLALLGWLAVRVLARRTGLLLAVVALAPASALAATTPGPATTWPSLDRAPMVSNHAEHHTQRYVVRPGDTLWGIAAAHLPGTPTATEIGKAWPAWWTTNRQVVGDNPDLIHPGQRLAAPERRHP
jgi:nucleoid-associated protein YgaU